MVESPEDRVASVICPLGALLGAGQLYEKWICPLRAYPVMEMQLGMQLPFWRFSWAKVIDGKPRRADRVCNSGTTLGKLSHIGTDPRSTSLIRRLLKNVSFVKLGRLQNEGNALFENFSDFCY
jgi:hypothetical protein